MAAKRRHGWRRFRSGIRRPDDTCDDQDFVPIEEKAMGCSIEAPMDLEWEDCGHDPYEDYDRYDEYGRDYWEQCELFPVIAEEQDGVVHGANTWGYTLCGEIVMPNDNTVVRPVLNSLEEAMAWAALHVDDHRRVNCMMCLAVMT